MDIRLDNLEHSDVVVLINTHLQHMSSITPEGSVYAIGVEALKSPDTKFWTAWMEDELLGCGALRDLGNRHGEIKSMRTVEKYLRTGVASAILRHIIQYAKTQGFIRVSLETGITNKFRPAHLLYQHHGFIKCTPFGDYLHDPDPHSLFMTLEI